MVQKGLAAAVLFILVSFSAFAQSNRSAVSSAGLDTNPCTVASPCRSFSTAVSHTNAGGEVIALDSAGYGPFSITTAITVSGAPGVHAAITVTSGDAITVTAAGQIVAIRNLVFDGTGATHAINQATARRVFVANCLLQGFGTSIWVQSGDLTVDHCQFVQSNGTAIFTQNDGSTTSHETITDCLMDGAGLYVDGSNEISVVRTTIANTIRAVYLPVVTGPGSTSTVNLKECTIAGNTSGIELAVGLSDSGYVYLSGNLVAYNGTAVLISGNGTAAVYTFSNNTFDSNTSAGAAMTPVSLN